MSTMVTVSQKDINNLEVQAVVFGAMCGISGLYFSFFVTTLLLTTRKSGRSSKNLRIISIVMFIIAVVHFVSRCIDFNQARILPQPTDERTEWITPLRVVESFCTRLAGALSDGLLAFRFWVIFDRKRWALYIPMIAIGLNFLLGIGLTTVNLAIYRHIEDVAYANTIGLDVLKITAAWGWSMFAINTTLTLMILVKIVVARSSRAISHISTKTPLSSAVEAMIESALVTWIGLLFYEIASLAPEGHYTTTLNVGYVAVCILPFIFGISQCLITIRFSLVELISNQNTNLTSIVFVDKRTTLANENTPEDAHDTRTDSSTTLEANPGKDTVS